MPVECSKRRHKTLVRFRLTAFGAAAVAALLVGAPAKAINFVSAGGIGPLGENTWDNVSGGSNLTYAETGSGPGDTYTIRWGSGNSGQSGFQWTGNVPGAPIDIDFGTPVSLGNLNHINFPISGAINSVDLNLRVILENPGNPNFDFTLTIPFTLDETPNSTPCPFPDPQANGPCDDKVTVPRIVAPDSPVQIPGGNEFLVVELEWDGGTVVGDNVEQRTGESQQNPNLGLTARFQRVPAAGPLAGFAVFATFSTKLKKLRKRYRIAS